jgi:hypothetical protein
MKGVARVGFRNRPDRGVCARVGRAKRKRTKSHLSSLRTALDSSPTAGEPQKYTHGIHAGIPKKSGLVYAYR